MNLFFTYVSKSKMMKVKTYIQYNPQFFGKDDGLKLKYWSEAWDSLKKDLGLPTDAEWISFEYPIEEYKTIANPEAP